MDDGSVDNVQVNLEECITEEFKSRQIRTNEGGKRGKIMIKIILLISF